MVVVGIVDVGVAVEVDAVGAGGVSDFPRSPANRPTATAKALLMRIYIK